VTAAQVDLKPPDFDEANRRLEQARTHFATANLAGVDRQSAYILLYSAAHKATSAALLAAGRKVSAGDGAHKLQISETGKLLGKDHAQLMTRLDRARIQRNRIAYESEVVGQNELTALCKATEETLAVVETFIAERRK
jgi:hypothetical protein